MCSQVPDTNTRWRQKSGGRGAEKSHLAQLFHAVPKHDCPLRVIALVCERSCHNEE